MAKKKRYPLVLPGQSPARPGQLLPGQDDNRDLDKEPDVAYHVTLLTNEVGLLLVTEALGIQTPPADDVVLDMRLAQGAMVLPNLTETERDSLTALPGMLIYNSTADEIQAYTSAGGWAPL